MANTTSYMGGYYTCVATNRGGAISSNMTLIVQDGAINESHSGAAGLSKLHLGLVIGLVILFLILGIVVAVIVTKRYQKPKVRSVLCALHQLFHNRNGHAFVLIFLLL